MDSLLENLPRFWYFYVPTMAAALLLVIPSLPHLWRQRDKVAAVALLSFRESIRKKALAAAAIAAIIIFSSTPFVSALGEPGAKLKMVQLVCIIALNVFGCLVAVVLGAFSLPTDIADKTIFSVVTKPIRRECVVAGKILGLASVTLLSFSVVAIISFAAIRLAGAQEADQAAAGRLLSGRRFVYAPHMQAVGDEVVRHRDGQVWVKAQKGSIEWTFSRLHKHVMPATTVTAHFYATISASDVISNDIPATVSFSNPATGEYLELPAVRLRDMELTNCDFPASLISPDGELDVSLSADRAGDSFAVKRDDLRLGAAPCGQVPNFIRAMVMQAAQFVLVVVISVAGSTFLSARVSVLFAVFVVFCGYINDFISDLAKAAFVAIPAPHQHGPAAPEAPTLLVTWINTALKEFLNVFSAVAPDFREFAVGKYLVDGLYVSPETVWKALGYMLVYAIIAFALAKAVVLCREME